VFDGLPWPSVTPPRKSRSETMIPGFPGVVGKSSGPSFDTCGVWLGWQGATEWPSAHCAVMPPCDFWGGGKEHRYSAASEGIGEMKTVFLARLESSRRSWRKFGWRSRAGERPTLFARATLLSSNQTGRLPASGSPEGYSRSNSWPDSDLPMKKMAARIIVRTLGPWLCEPRVTPSGSRRTSAARVAGCGAWLP
jgi:hypothetical protein